MPSTGLAPVVAHAVVAEQLVHFVQAVGGATPRACGDFVAYVHAPPHTPARHVTLVAFPDVWPEVETGQKAFCDALNAAVSATLAEPGLQSLTVLAPVRPAAAPPDCECRHDAYLGLEVPPFGSGRTPQKLRNMISRAQRDVTIERETWSAEHAALVQHYITTRPLAPGTRRTFQAIPRYLQAAPGAVLFAARSRPDHSLQSFVVGDYSGLSSAFYLFAFRYPQSPPGCADALLAALLREAENRGHSAFNLGLGIHQGIVRFKNKWRCHTAFPYVETSWSVPAPSSGWLTAIHRLFAQSR